ncbi:MAG: serine/threonine protein kinase [Phycisphaerales bacterium]|nr:serine/threonine protein kinase [Phycisphaerales bacterium]
MITDVITDTHDFNGAVIMGCEIIEHIGQGGMGHVFLAQQLEPQRIVALKVLGPTRLGPNREEADRQARCEHDGIARVYDSGTAPTPWGERYCIIMEYVRGKPITATVAESRRDHERILRFIVAICEAVQHAHQKGIVHRDLKPSNILIDNNDKVKIVDFGIAAPVDADEEPSSCDGVQLAGTPRYMSPEQAAGRGKLDFATDVYSIGVVAYELLSGISPYGELDHMLLHELLAAVEEARSRKLGKVVRRYRGDVEIIVAKAMERDKACRYSSADRMASDIRRYLNHEPIEARPKRTIYTLRKFVRRNCALTLTAIIAFVAVGTYAVMERVQRHRAQTASLAERIAKEVAAEQRDALRKKLRNVLIHMAPAVGGQPQPEHVSLARALADAAECAVTFGPHDPAAIDTAIEQQLFLVRYLSVSPSGIGTFTERRDRLRKIAQHVADLRAASTDPIVQLRADFQGANAQDELGRICFEENDWIAADQYFSKALSLLDHAETVLSQLPSAISGPVVPVVSLPILLDKKLGLWVAKAKIAKQFGHCDSLVECVARVSGTVDLTESTATEALPPTLFLWKLLGALDVIECERRMSQQNTSDERYGTLFEAAAQLQRAAAQFRRLNEGGATVAEATLVGALKVVSARAAVGVIPADVEERMKAILKPS